MNNLIKTTLLLGALTGLLMLIGGLMGGQRGVEIAFILSLGMNFFSYWFSDKLVLKAYNAQELSQSDAPELYSIVRELTTAAGTPMPRLYLVQSDELRIAVAVRGSRCHEVTAAL